jgi:hypothetical protein
MARRPNIIADDDVNREERFDIRLSVAEAAALREAAAAAKQRRTTYIRSMLFGTSRSSTPVPRAEIQQLIRTLTSIGVNLNQLVRALNSGDPLDEPLRAQLAIVLASLTERFADLARLVT